MKNFILSTGCLAALVAGCMLADDKAGDPDKGKEVFEACAGCHSVETGGQKPGPSLNGLFKKAKLKNGKPVNEANVLAMVNTGGGNMPAFADTLSDEEKKNLLAYLKTL